MNKSHTVKLMDWIKHRYGEKYKNFISHQTANGEFSQLPMWSMYGDPCKAMEKEALISGASMRNKMLYRTVAGTGRSSRSHAPQFFPLFFPEQDCATSSA